MRKRMLPELANRIIFATGDTLSDCTSAFLQNVRTPYVTKPFMIRDLKKASEEVLQHDVQGS